MLTYQDFLKHQGSGIGEFLLQAIEEHKSSPEYRTAIVAEQYDRQQNTTILSYQKYLYTMKGAKIPDVISPNHKLCSNFFNRFTTQLVQYLLGNGVTFAEEGVKEKLGTTFDTELQRAGKYAEISGVSFGFWDLDKLRVFKFTEFKPLYDEENGSLRVGIRFWQLAPNKPLRMTLYEEDGYTEYIKKDRQNVEILAEKRPYKLIVKSTEADGTELYDGGNYPSFPIVPLYANDYHQSELTGMRANIDAYDLIKSGFANDLDGHLLYWLIQNAGGMDDVDVAKVLERIKTMGAAISSDEGTIEQKQINIPYESRIAYLDRLEQDLYKDFGALKVENITAGGTTATQIKSAYAPLDMKATGLEYQCIEFVQNILKLQGIEATPQFKRDKIANYQDETTMVLQSANYLDTETVLKHLPFLSPDEINDILKAKEEEEAERYEIAQQISQGKGFNPDEDEESVAAEETEDEENEGEEEQGEETEGQSEEEKEDEQEERKEDEKRTPKNRQTATAKRKKAK